MGRKFMSTTLIAVAITLMFVPETTMANQHVVGDEAGWSQSVDYVAWVMKESVFFLGDTLVFKYPVGQDNVYEVDENGYNNCIVPESGALTSGNDIVSLDKIRSYYFISGVGSHCKKGQKLALSVEGMSILKQQQLP